MTRQQALDANHGDVLHYGRCSRVMGPRGGAKLRIQQWRVNGACKTWKTRPEAFSLPIKYGYMGPYGYVTNLDAVRYHLAVDCPVLL